MTLDELKKNAKGGDAEAQNILGMLYLRGEHVEKDLKAASKWFQKAADQGNATAMYNLAQMYANGDGVKQSSKKAFEWFKKSADAGDADAAYRVGGMYLQGEGVDKDIHRGVAWLVRASLGGNEDAKDILKSLGMDVPDGAEAKEGSAPAPEEEKSAAPAEGAGGFNPLLIRVLESRGIPYDDSNEKVLGFNVVSEECRFTVYILFGRMSVEMGKPDGVGDRPYFQMMVVLEDDGDVHLNAVVRENVSAAQYGTMHETCNALNSKQMYVKYFLDEEQGTVTAAWNCKIDSQAGPDLLIEMILGIGVEAIAPSLSELRK